MMASGIDINSLNNSKIKTFKPAQTQIETYARNYENWQLYISNSLEINLE